MKSPAKKGAKILKQINKGKQMASTASDTKS